MDEVEVVLDHHPNQFLGEKAIQKCRNCYILIAKNGMKVNAGICLLLHRNHHVIIVEEDMRESASYSPEHAWFMEKSDIGLNNALVGMMREEPLQSLQYKSLSPSRPIAKKGAGVVLPEAKQLVTTYVLKHKLEFLL